MFGTTVFGVEPFGSAPAYVMPAAATAENVLILSPRVFDLATLAASTAVSSLSVTNLQNQEPTKVWRTTSAIGQYVDITLAAPLACDALAMAGFNMGAAGIWRLKAYASAGDVGGAVALDSGWQSVWPSSGKHDSPVWGPEAALLRVDNDVAYRFWRIEFSDPGAGMVSLDIGRLALGRAVQFSINCDYEAGIGFVPNDVQEPNGYGQVFTDPRPYAQRRFDMQWFGLGRKEVHNTAMELSRLRGQAGDVFIFLDPAETTRFHRWSMQALFAGQAQYVAKPFFVADDDGLSHEVWGFNFSLIQKL